MPFRDPSDDLIELPSSDPGLRRLAGQNLIFNLDDRHAGQRLDGLVAGLSGLDRTRAGALIDFGAVWLNGRVSRCQARLVSADDYLTVQVPRYGPIRFYEADADRILYQDDWLLAYNKEANIPCQQTPYDGYNNLYAALLRLKPERYLALHHRLDGPTSGVMVFACRRQANPGLSRLFRDGPLVKIYLAVIKGVPSRDVWLVDRPIAKRKGGYFCPDNSNGKPARTRFTVLARGRDRCLVEARPLTGRTHQIRLHSAVSGHPLLGDTAYLGPAAPRLMLHARSLSFDHPITGRPLTLKAPRPRGFAPEDMTAGEG